LEGVAAARASRSAECALDVNKLEIERRLSVGGADNGV
jgi:hypothetical protein